MEEEKKEEERKLPPIREGKDVKEDEPKITCGGKVAAIPQPTQQGEA